MLRHLGSSLSELQRVEDKSILTYASLRISSEFGEKGCEVVAAQPTPPKATPTQTPLIRLV